jgi:hypothetical protein
MPAPSPTLNAAHRQWSQRPADERFWNLKDLHNHVQTIRERSTETPTGLDTLRVEATANDDLMLSRGGGKLGFTNWSFSQLCRRVGAPASYLHDLPATLTANCLNASIKKENAENGTDNKIKLLHYQNGSNRLRAVTGPDYCRIWNGDVTSRLVRLSEEQGWRNPPTRTGGAKGEASRVATAADCMGASFVQPGDMISPGGLYASDRDMFAFLVDPTKVVDDGSEHGLYRGFFAQNSEVGDCSWVLTFFLFRGTCGNHIIHGGKLLREIRIRHVGTANDRAATALKAQLTEYANASVDGEEQMIRNAKHFSIGPNKEEVLDTLFGLKIASRVILETSWDRAIENSTVDVDGSPDTAWGFAQALTRYSQTIPYTDKRTELDRAAGKVLALAS